MNYYQLYTVVPYLLKFLDNLTNIYVRFNCKRLKGRSREEDCRTVLSTLFNMKDGVELDRIQLWFETHLKKKTDKWSDAKSEEIYNRMLEIKDKADTEGPPITLSFLEGQVMLEGVVQVQTHLQKLKELLRNN